MSLRSSFARSAFLTLCLFLLLVGWSTAQAPTAALKVGPLLGRPVVELEKVLGKPKHIGPEAERYYRCGGLIRVVVVLTPQKATETITFQFAPGQLKDETAALAWVGVTPEQPLRAPWFPQWHAPGGSGNDELTISREVLPEKTVILKPTRHFLQRMKERGIPPQAATELLESGQRFYDPKNDSYIYWKSGIFVAMAKDGALKTVVRGPISKRWKPLD